MRRLLALLILVGAFVVGSLAPAGALRPDLYNCHAYKLATSGYSKCSSGTGLQRVRLTCYNGVDYSVEYGPWTGKGVASWEECNNGRSAVSASVDFP